jgi:hypothetical protein
MPVIPFGEYRPDLSDYEAQTEKGVLNVVPRGDGYGPFPSLTALSLTLGAQCRGAFAAYKTDGSVVVFAATSTNLYQLNNTTYGWTNVSLGGGPYAAVTASEQWSFAQFNNLVIAVQANVAPQVFDISSSTAFANLAGSPPQARYVDVVGRFVVLTGLSDQREPRPVVGLERRERRQFVDRGHQLQRFPRPSRRRNHPRHRRRRIRRDLPGQRHPAHDLSAGRSPRVPD